MKRMHNTQSPRTKVALVIVLALLSLAGFGLLGVRDSIPLPLDKPQPENSDEVLVGFTPYRITIPSIGVSAPVVPVGVDALGNMAVPEELLEVGWYEPGFKPGEMGSAVFAGHVNSRFGLPTIFQNLEAIQLDDTFSITSEDGQELVFKVVAKNIYDFRTAPLEEIYGPHDEPTINLITCDEDLWLGAEGTYKDRLVVTAVLVSDEPDF